MTYEGETFSSLEDAFHNAVNFYLDRCQREGRSPDKPFDRNLNVRINTDLHRAACLNTAEENCSLDELAGKALDAFMANVKAA